MLEEDDDFWMSVGHSELPVFDFWNDEELRKVLKDYIQTFLDNDEGVGEMPEHMDDELIRIDFKNNKIDKII